MFGNRRHRRDALVRIGERHRYAVGRGERSFVAIFKLDGDLDWTGAPGDTVMLAIALLLQKCVKKGSSGSSAATAGTGLSAASDLVRGSGARPPMPWTAKGTVTGPACSNASDTET